MPKSVDIEDFAAKLGLVVRRLDWGRARLAQQVGIDKSLAGRWLKGESRPTPHSLSRLTSAIGSTMAGLKGGDWDLPLDRFALRIGVAPPVGAPSADHVPETRLMLGGLKSPPPAEWGEPYLGLWAGFYQGFTNKGRVRIGAVQFFINDLGLRCRATEGNFLGEGPALATRTHLQCLFDVGPFHDRLAFCMFNAVHGPKAAIIDGLFCVGDAAGTPTSSPTVLFRIDETLPDSDTVDMNSLAGVIGQLNEHALKEVTRTGDPLAVVRDIAPPEVLQAAIPVGKRGDHVLRMPPSRSLATSTLGTCSMWRTVAANFRRVLGLERTRPQLRVLVTAAE
jgi:hypothetical protein